MDKVLIIAEAGVNHNGDISTAFRMIDAAKKAGADIVKFQTAKPELVVSKFAEKAGYQKKTTDNYESQLDMLKRLYLRFEDYVILRNYCKELGIGFLSTPFDLESIDFLATLNMDFWKIPSGEITNLPYLEKIGATKKNVIMSTGMCELNEIQAAIDVLEAYGTMEITLLHCNTEYPTPFEDVNLLAMLQMKESLKKEVGYSDHTLGIEVPIAAVALGARVIEKHFTLNRNMEGPDHKASLEPDELRNMVQLIRNIEKSLGTGKKTRSASESKNVSIARKSVVAKEDIHIGELFTCENLTVKRPGTGISPMNWYKIIGKRASREYSCDEIICEKIE